MNVRIPRAHLRASHFLKLMLTALLVGPCSVAVAQTSTLRTDLYPKIFPKNFELPEKPLSEKPFSGEVRFESMNYLTPAKNAPELTQSQFLSTHLKYTGEKARFENRADVRAGTFFTPGESHILVQELYTSLGTATSSADSSDVRLSVGRKKHSWSLVDADWDLGVWQPYYEIDALRPEQQGLTGAFLGYQQDNFEVLAFATPLFIPNMGPSTREENGSLVTQSRWVQDPPKEAGFANKVNTLNYKLTVPEASEVINHAGYALTTRLGDKQQGLWLSSSLGYTPVNQLLVGRSLRRSIDTGKMGVTVKPEITYHTLWAVDLGYAAEEFGATLSYLQDAPETVLPEEGWALQKISSIKAVAAGVYWKIPALKTRNVLIKLDHLRSQGGSIQDIVSDGSKDAISSDQSRLKFSNAYRVRAQGEVARIFQRPLLTQLSWLYDQEQKGSMINSEIQFLPARNWAVLMGADFLGVDEETPEVSGFLSQYRANDRVYGGMSYVF